MSETRATYLTREEQENLVIIYATQARAPKHPDPDKAEADALGITHSDLVALKMLTDTLEHCGYPGAYDFLTKLIKPDGESDEAVF